MLFYFCHKTLNVVKAFTSNYRFSGYLLTCPPGGAGFGAFLIFHATMSAFDAYDGNTIPEYTGLVVFSDPEEHSVLQLD